MLLLSGGITYSERILRCLQIIRVCATSYHRSSFRKNRCGGRTSCHSFTSRLSQKNVVANALSQKPLVQAISAIHHSIFEDMVDQYAIDTDFADIFTRIRDWETVAGYSIREGYLMRKTMLYVTQPLREKVMTECHCPPFTGHRGIATTMKGVERYFYWPRLKKDVEEFVRSCLFQALRTMVRTNPQILHPMLLELGKQNPQLLRLINENQAEFFRLINEPGAEGEEGDLLGQLADAMPQATINISPEEREAIARLEGLGFDRARVIEAYLACDRNELLAANYLLEDHGDNEE
ncbi:hypothetical protein L7F22_046361 [Adiantum nelumboides]|nr:hypothetical protein [Adiantum nelumboides]